jgi:hypothetical protein
LKMPSISQSAMSNTSSSQAPDLPSNIDSAQVSAYAQALLAGSNISPASFREVRILSVSVIYWNKGSPFIGSPTLPDCSSTLPDCSWQKDRGSGSSSSWVVEAEGVCYIGW